MIMFTAKVPKQIGEVDNTSNNSVKKIFSIFTLFLLNQQIILVTITKLLFVKIHGTVSVTVCSSVMTNREFAFF